MSPSRCCSPVIYRSARRGRGDQSRKRRVWQARRLRVRHIAATDRLRSFPALAGSGGWRHKASTLVIIVSSVNGPLPSSPTPIVAAPAVTGPFFKNDRRVVGSAAEAGSTDYFICLAPSIWIEDEARIVPRVTPRSVFVGRLGRKLRKLSDCYRRGGHSCCAISEEKRTW